ncbi:IS3 family transposase [Streptomyces sp. NPDC058991]|uniref:IS3 family transposase n=1 Tax=unclassified Streptomyces TaxID=2593676 RepID=UPI0036BFFC0D
MAGVHASRRGEVLPSEPDSSILGRTEQSSVASKSSNTSLRHTPDVKLGGPGQGRPGRGPTGSSTTKEREELRRKGPLAPGREADPRGAYGAPRITTALRREGRRFNRQKAERLMLEYDIHFVEGPGAIPASAASPVRRGAKTCTSGTGALTGMAHRLAAGGAGLAEIGFERCAGASTVAR